MWDIIENGPTIEEGGSSDGKRAPPKTDAERNIRQSETKGLSTLLLAIPNEYRPQFYLCANAKILQEALEKSISGRMSIKRNQKAILKQQYEHFLAGKNESNT